MKPKITERGWAGHFICGQKCKFHRNTLIEYNDIAIVVSTVGLLPKFDKSDGYEEIGCHRYFETMAFHTDKTDTRFKDINVSHQIYFDSPWSIDIIDADDRANDMHDTVVNEISNKLISGEKFNLQEEVANAE